MHLQDNDSESAGHLCSLGHDYCIESARMSEMTACTHELCEHTFTKHVLRPNTGGVIFAPCCRDHQPPTLKEAVVRKELINRAKTSSAPDHELNEAKGTFDFQTQLFGGQGIRCSGFSII